MENDVTPVGVFNGVKIQSNGSMSDSDARIVRKRLRVIVTADIVRLSEIIAEITKLHNRLANIESMEFTVEDLTDPDKEF